MSFVHEILAAAERRGAEPLLIEVHGARLSPMSGEEFCRRVRRIRSTLIRLGVERGARVGLFAPNSADWAVADVALLAHGAIVVPLYARQEPAQLAAMLRDAGAELVIAADSALAASLPGEFIRLTFAEALDGSAAISGRYAASSSKARENSSLVETQRARDDRASAPPEPPPAAPDDPVTIIYTSGTSGEPKGVVLSRANVDFMLDVTVARIRKMTAQARAEDRVFHYLPFCFAGSRIMLWSQLRRGNPLLISTDLDDLPQELRSAAPHYFLNVPVLLDRIKNGVERKLEALGGPIYRLYARALDAHAAEDRAALGMRERMLLRIAERLLFPRIRRQLGENLEFLVCGSARLHEDTQRWFAMIGLPVYQVYGLTETTGIVSIDDTDEPDPRARIGWVGYAVPGCELALNDEGELLCRGPNVFAGYWKKPEATAAALRDGWLHTGDQAELAPNGRLKIIGRMKDVIVPASGHNVAPAPIEDLLQEASGIDQALVIGHGRPFLTALVTGPIAEAELERELARVNAALPHYQRLRKAVRAREPFTAENGLLTATQKLRRAAIEAHYRDAIEEMYR